MSSPPTDGFVRGSHAVLVLAVAVVLAGPSRAGAWTPAPGGFYGKLAVNYLEATEEYDDAGAVVDFQFDGEFQDRNLTLYAEYGLLEGLALFGSLPFKSIHYENSVEAGTTSGVGDVELGLRVRLLRHGSLVFSAHGLAKVPGGYDEDDRLPLGNGQRDLEARLLVGQSLLSGRMYYGVEGGYRQRAEEPSDEWRYLLELGGQLGRRVYARAKLDGLVSAENADAVRDVFGNPVTTLEADLLKVETTLGISVAKRGFVELSYTPTLDGASTAKSQTYGIAWVTVR